MATSTLKIILQTIKQGTGEKQAKKDLEGLTKSVGQATAAMAAAGTAVYALKKAYDFAKEGAQLEFVEERFWRLADSIGTNSGLMEDLQEVTRGLYSDTELMNSANDLMGLGLAKNSEELLRLANVSAGLNMNMSQLVLTLTNMTAMRFDALGVSVDGFDEKMKDLEEQGYATNDAFKEAFLQQAEAQLVKVGNAADSNAGAFMRFESAIKDVSDQLKKMAAESSADFISREADNMSALAELISGKFKAVDFQFFSDGDIFNFKTQLKTIADLQRDAFKEMSGEQLVSQRFTDSATKSYQTMAFAVQELGYNFGRTSEEQAGLTATTFDADAAMADFNAHMDTLNEYIGSDLTQSWEEHNQKIAEYKTLLADAKTEEERQGILGQIDAETEAYRQRAAQILYNIQSRGILAAVEANPALAAEAQEMLINQANTLGLVDDAYKELASRQAAVIELWAKGKLTGEEATRAMGTLAGFTEELGENSTDAQTPVEEITGNVDDLAIAALKAKDTVHDTIGQLKNLDGMAVTATVNIVVNGSVPSLGNSGTVIPRNLPHPDQPLNGLGIGSMAAGIGALGGFGGAPSIVMPGNGDMTGRLDRLIDQNQRMTGEIRLALMAAIQQVMG